MDNKNLKVEELTDEILDDVTGGGSESNKKKNKLMSSAAETLLSSVDKVQIVNAASAAATSADYEVSAISR